VLSSFKPLQFANSFPVLCESHQKESKLLQEILVDKLKVASQGGIVQTSPCKFWCKSYLEGKVLLIETALLQSPFSMKNDASGE
jgi:hypothetical protein